MPAPQLHPAAPDVALSATVAGKRPPPSGARKTSAHDAYHQAQLVRFPARFRKLPIIGVVLVSLFYVVDLYYPWPVYVDLTAGDFMVIRLSWDAMFAVCFVASYWRSTDERWQIGLDYGLGIGTALFLGILCAHTGRLASPYYSGMLLLTIARCTVLPGFLQRAVGFTVATLVVFVVSACSLPSLLPRPDASGGAWMLSLGVLVSGNVLVLIGAQLADRLALGLEAAKIMGRYQLLRRLGAGGMGEVYYARHASLRRACAVKLLKPELCTPDSVARFEREAEAASRLRHPNTIAVFDFGRTDEGQPYYVMEYLDGCDLRDLVDRDGLLPPERVEYLLVQAAGSLAEAHRLSMVHRDVQPGNLFVTSNAGHGDFIKVLDFGLVKGADLGPDLTQQNAFMGTPRYMSPEALTGKKVGPPSDVYSLGAVGYFLLCGHPPFFSDDSYADMHHQIHDPPPPISSEREPSLPQPSVELVAVLMRCLEKDPEARFAEAADVVTWLKATPEHGRWRPPDAPITTTGPIPLAHGPDTDRHQYAERAPTIPRDVGRSD